MCVCVCACVCVRALARARVCVCVCHLRHQVALTTRISMTFSLPNRPYHSSLSAGLPNYILCPRTPDVDKF